MLYYGGPGGAQSRNSGQRFQGGGIEFRRTRLAKTTLEIFPELPRISLYVRHYGDEIRQYGDVL